MKTNNVRKMTFYSDMTEKIWKKRFQMEAKEGKGENLFVQLRPKGNLSFEMGSLGFKRTSWWLSFSTIEGAHAIGWIYIRLD
mmetsp:Transcript_23208/g.56333  ORF Transcript_23208/g.56333 Transcript_23208/m.56333 type:complete len:82 (-) Transcript_23208:190-435(-)